ncbi:hypothetical protein [Acinetobacter sp. YH12201]|uniref:hypothetical protein n=1 Tax=Acinetobacter sp. YH12201 TaxID=2601140 RepID=UPI0015D18309|nr:hypothetical protein [Acinetobacter sp. YH12201]
MEEIKKISRIIENVYLYLNKLENELFVNDFSKYPSLHGLLKLFNNIDNDWKYFFPLKSENLESLLNYLKLYSSKNDQKYLDKIDIFSRNILDELQKVSETPSISWKEEEEEAEKEIQKKLSFISYSLNIENKFQDLNSKFEELNNQRKNIEQTNAVVIRAQNEANKIIQDLKSKNEAYNQIIDEDSNFRIKKLYNEIYDDEIGLADKYRNWALLIFAIIGAFLLVGFLNLSIQNWNHLRDSSYIHIPFGWDSLLKTLMLFSLTTPAWYLTRESSKHRKVAYKAKILGTELASFPLYAREFKDEDRLELRKSLADRFFGQELYNYSSNTKNSNDVSIEQVKLIAEANKVLAESLKVKQNLS